MPRCAHCGSLIAGQPVNCPECLAAFEDPSVDLWPETGEHDYLDESDRTSNELVVTIARFPNVAEAGFFAHELMHRESLPVQLSVDESFDASGGYWSTRFLLSVPESRAESAAAILQQMIEQTATDAWEPDDSDYNLGVAAAGSFRSAQSSSAEDGSIHWLPIVITLAAGSFVLWGARKFQEVPQRRGVAPAGREHGDLWDDLSSNSKPWVQALDNGRGVRELRIEENAAVLSTDADGNGHFEGRERFERPFLAK